MREERKKQVEEHVETVNRLLKEARKAGTDGVDEESSDDDPDAFGGFPDEPIQPVDLEEEYIDEDKYTNVTVEAVSIDRDGMHKPDATPLSSDEDEEDEEKKNKTYDEPKKAKKEWPKKTKKKKFTYETKLERSISERKRKAKSAR